MKYPKISPSALFLITLLIGMFFSWVYPWHLTWYLEYVVVQSIGVTFLFISLILNTLAYREFKRSRTPFAPFMKPSVLITKSVFSVSRNPVYLALVLSECGLAFVFDTAWLLCVTLILFIGLHYLIVLDEEAVLQKRFRKRYEHYKQHTRRWF